MHRCELAARVSRATGSFGSHCPRKAGLNWFMPALQKSSVGSLCGTTGDDGTRVCAFLSAKKRRKVVRTRSAGHSSLAAALVRNVRCTLVRVHLRGDSARRMAITLRRPRPRREKVARFAGPPPLGSHGLGCGFGFGLGLGFGFGLGLGFGFGLGLGLGPRSRSRRHGTGEGGGGQAVGGGGMTRGAEGGAWVQGWGARAGRAARACGVPAAVPRAGETPQQAICRSKGAERVKGR